MKVTYIIYSHQNKAVKIGYASDLSSRISALQISTPEKLSLIFAFEGGKETEKALHTLLHKYRLRGEWFDFTTETLEILLDYQKQTLLRNTSVNTQTQDINDYLTTETAIVETAVNFKRLFTIPQLKKELPSLRLETKDIESLLLRYGWKIKQYGKSRVKYFYRED